VQPLPSPTGQTKNSTVPTKPPLTKPQPHKKTSASNCSTSPTPLNPAVGNVAGVANPTDVSANPGSTNPDTTSGSTNSASLPAKPCPPPKKVVRNGGSEEPTVQLTGGTTAQQVSRQRSTDQLRVATEENLKKIAGRQLNATQQEMVNQIKQFLEQSKTAVAAGDLERGHNLAMKARLLSDELVKP